MGTRRIIVVVMVTGLLVAVAEAGFQIGTRYTDDRPFDPDTDTLLLDESLYLSIFTDEEFRWVSTFNYGWALLSDPLLATITGGEIGPDAEGGWMDDAWCGDGRAGCFDHEYYYSPGLYADNFLYSPQSIGDSTVRFWRLDPGGELSEVVDSVIINQVPEPTTFLLLATGVVALSVRNRKRKKQSQFM